MKVLANDGISESGKIYLEKAGFEVLNTKVAQEQLANFINENAIDALLVRSATEVNKGLIDKCTSLKLIGRGGVGMDNIAVEYAKAKGVHVINTPDASSSSVAELVFAHLYGGVRYLYDANRNMPLEGDSKFKQLKKAYAQGIELRGKTLGIIGFGRIGQEVAKLALGVGMKVVFTDHHEEERLIEISFFDGQKVKFQFQNNTLEDVLRTADFISIHVPSQNDYVIGASEFEQMKDGVGIINASRGGTLDEVALVSALGSGKVGFAGLDVFESEPNPEIRVLMHPNISLTPHIGASTKEAQDRIGLELATQITTLLN
ncbi:D-2-hydroxyacid dehydrogenase [uncultured Croceitalea sp.]|uniref:D-2-hydroxyacid dehydrogenase n=1 Tax=uncultured Croceitalea sp. TaxID=1798908 RepID=UPI003305667C